MTLDPQPQEEYIITEAQLKDFVYWDICKLSDRKEIEQQIRSRPAATSLKYPDTIKESDPQQYKAYMESVGDKESYDTAIRNATLDEFMNAIEFRFDDTNQGRGVVGTIRGIKESLRGKP